MKSTGYSYWILIKLEFSWLIFEKSQVSNFIKIRPVGAKLFLADRRSDRQTDRWTDEYDEADSRFSQFCERA
jgi:hypothetical protein